MVRIDVFTSPCKRSVPEETAVAEKSRLVDATIEVELDFLVEVDHKIVQQDANPRNMARPDGDLV